MQKKILVWIDRSLVNFVLAKYLQENIECELYSIYDVIEKPKEYFEKQKLVKFEKSWYFHDHILKTENKIDKNYLNKIEKKYAIPLWLIASNDRFFNNFNQYYNFSYNEILQILQDEIKLFEKILSEVKPDCVIMQMSNLQHNHLFFEMCKAQNIQILSPHGARINIDPKKSTHSSQVYLRDDPNPCLPIPDEENIKEKRDEFVIENEEEYSKKFSYEYENSKTKYLKAGMNFLFSNNKNVKTHYTYFGRTKIKVIYQMILYELRKKYRESFMSKNLQNNIDDEDFIYFPLHQEMERVLLIGSPFNTNQFEIIKNIASSMPFGYKLYIKDHPTMNARGWRSVEQMKEIMKLYNVVLLHPSVNSNKLLEKCKLVISIAGTVSIQAATFHKPSISFEKIGLYKLSSLTIIDSIKDLPKIIRRSLEQEIDKREIEIFKKAVYSETFEYRFDDLKNVFNDVLTTGGYNANTEIKDEQVSVLCQRFDKEFTYAAKKYIEKMKEEKIKND